MSGCEKVNTSAWQWHVHLDPAKPQFENCHQTCTAIQENLEAHKTVEIAMEAFIRGAAQRREELLRQFSSLKEAVSINERATLTEFDVNVAQTLKIFRNELDSFTVTMYQTTAFCHAGTIDVHHHQTTKNGDGTCSTSIVPPVSCSFDGLQLLQEVLRTLKCVSVFAGCNGSDVDIDRARCQMLLDIRQCVTQFQETSNCQTFWKKVKTCQQQESPFGFQVLSSVQVFDPKINFSTCQCAVNEDGTLVAFVDLASHEISMCTLASRRFSKVFSIPTRSSSLWFSQINACFVPGKNNNLLVADSGVNVLEVTVEGRYVRSLFVNSVLHHTFHCVDSNGLVVVAAGPLPGAEVCDYASGELLQSFGGDIGVIDAIKLSPDGRCVAALWQTHGKISVFSLSGEIVREFETHARPTNLAFLGLGQIAVYSRNISTNDDVCVYSCDGMCVTKRLPLFGKLQSICSVNEFLFVFGNCCSLHVLW